MKMGLDKRLISFGSKKKKSNGNGVCAQFRALRKRSRQLIKQFIRDEV